MFFKDSEFGELLILDPGLSDGVLCNHPCLSVIRPWSVFKYLRDRALVFPETLHEVMG